MAARFTQLLTSPVLVGRQHELQALHQFLSQVKAGRGQVVLIAGEAGIGKSRLLAEAKTFAEAQGFFSCLAACFQMHMGLPYAPLLELLQAGPTSSPDSALPKALDSIIEALHQLLPGFAPFIAQPEQIQVDPEQKRYRLYTALTTYFTHLAADHPLMLMVEDAHWCDESTLEFLFYLIRHCHAQPIIFLITYRSDALGLELKRWLADVEREPMTHELRLAGLERAEVETMLRALLDLHRPLHADFLDVVVRLTEGNVFFIEEILKSLISSGAIDPAIGVWDRTSLEELNVPRTIQAAVQQRVEQLSDDARTIVQFAAVMGRQFDFAVLQELTQHTESELFTLMKELITAQLIVEESADLFVFRHALTRQALYADLLARERKRLHQAVAQGIVRIYAPHLERYTADLAYHFYEAGDWELAAQYAAQAGHHAQSLYALRPAIGHFTRAIEAAQNQDRPPLPELYRARGLAYEMLGEFKLALADLEVVLQVSESTEEHHLQWQTLLDLGLLWSGQDYTQAGQYYQHAFEIARQIQAPFMLAQSLNRLGNWHLNVEHPLEAHWHHQEALTIFQQEQDQKGIAETFDLLGMASYLGGDLVQGTCYYEQAVEQFYTLNQREGLISSLTTLTMRAATFQTDTLVSATATITEAQHDGESALRIAREIGHRSGETYALIMLGINLGSQGEYQRAFDLLERALALAEDMEHRQWETAALVALGGLHLEVLALDQAEGLLQRAMAIVGKVQSLHWLRNAVGFLASTYVQQGQLNDAMVLLQAHLDLNTPVRTLGQRLMWRAYTELVLAQMNGALALQSVERLRSATLHQTSDSVLPRLARLRGEALMLLEQYDGAEIELIRARDMATQQGAKPLLWRIHASLAQLYHRQSRHTEAQEQARITLTLVEALALQVPDALRTTFRSQGLTFLPQTLLPLQSESVKSSRYELTSREREVATLIALGSTNRQIAAQLVVSERTVETHVRNILSKLHLTSRTQVALWVVEAGPIKPPSSQQDN